MGTSTNQTLRLLRAGLLCGVLCWAPPVIAQSLSSAAHLAYIGTLDKKILVYDENKEEVVGEIPLQGIPRQTALTRDQSKLVILTTQMAVETVDLKTGKMINHFELADGRSRPRMSRGGGGLALDPAGRYLYATFRASVKETGNGQEDHGGYGTGCYSLPERVQNRREHPSPHLRQKNQVSRCRPSGQVLGQRLMDCPQPFQRARAVSTFVHMPFKLLSFGRWKFVQNPFCQLGFPICAFHDTHLRETVASGK